MTPPPSHPDDVQRSIVREVMRQEMPALLADAMAEALRIHVGIDTKSRESINDWNANQAWLQRAREAAEARAKSVSTLVITVAISAFGTAAGAWLLGLLKLGGGK